MNGIELIKVLFIFVFSFIVGQIYGIKYMREKHKRLLKAIGIKIAIT